MPSFGLTLRLPRPCSGLWDWQMRGLCRTTGSELFFARDGEGRGARIRRERLAKEICLQCPVRRACRNHAVTVSEPFGVWGGTTEADRRWLGRADPPHEQTPVGHGKRPGIRISPKYQALRPLPV